jgi:hypothetical protein
MTLYPYLFDILKYTVAGLGVVWIAFYLLKPYLDRSESMQLVELKKSISSQTLPLRLQAYERVVLFIERINPANMLIRLNAPVYMAAELHGLIINEIRTEYQHNVTQQLYVSIRAWGVVKRVKDDTISIVNSSFQSSPEDANGLDLSKLILSRLSNLDDNPYDISLGLIKKDMEELF